VAGVYGRTEPSKSTCWHSLSFPYKYGEVRVVLLHCGVCRQDELSVGSRRQKFDWDMWWWGAYLTPWDGSPVCEKRILTSPRAGENALESDMATEEVRVAKVNRNAVSPAQCGQTPSALPWSAH